MLFCQSTDLLFIPVENLKKNSTFCMSLEKLLSLFFASFAPWRFIFCLPQRLSGYVLFLYLIPVEFRDYLQSDECRLS